MNSVVKTSLLLAATLLFTNLPTTDALANPDMVHYQGFLRDDEGTPVVTSVDLVFTIYDAETDGNALWAETHDGVVPTDGVFSVALGSSNPISGSIFDGDDRWLETSVDGNVISPRRQFLSTPYAMRAAVADVALAGGEADDDWVIDGDDVYRQSGQVGVGITTPEARLHVDGGSGVGPFAVVSGGGAVFENITLRLHDRGVAGNNRNVLEFAHTENSGGPHVLVPGARLTSVSVSNDAVSGVKLVMETASNNQGTFNQNQLVLNNNGRVGVGTSNPTSELEVEGKVSAEEMSLTGGELEIVEFNGTPELHLSDGVSKAAVISQDIVGNMRFATGPLGNEVARFYVTTGGIFVEGTTTTDVLQITGGADLAEPFDVDPERKVEPGMVLSIDPGSPGELRVADRAYDRAVAGIASGAKGIRAGITLQQEQTMADGSVPVALSGRVYCLADASHGAIAPGDLLTSSSTPGHAMRVSDPDRAHGAILGKAMTSLESGRGHVLVLVTLH